MKPSRKLSTYNVCPESVLSSSTWSMRTLAFPRSAKVPKEVSIVASYLARELALRPASRRARECVRCCAHQGVLEHEILTKTEYEVGAVVATSQAEANAGYDNGMPPSRPRRFLPEPLPLGSRAPRRGAAFAFHQDS